MQTREMIIDSFLEVLKDLMLKEEDCERVLSQIGALCSPVYVPCKVIHLNSKDKIADTIKK
ncbi:hypothetical protein LCGC14_0364540 [marine sediment metagenome]|uniref:Uncharacterized protein n=1 Tax=marine sediment metagenome TaxID=412755 RepID=A0A0F9TPS6_9ZZZZ